uniref:Peptidase M12B domain-containing protein n=1 Tax=Anopheles maculatus TaxID=74869 RepID=A0A182TC65_9DIPT
MSPKVVDASHFSHPKLVWFGWAGLSGSPNSPTSTHTHTHPQVHPIKQQSAFTDVSPFFSFTYACGTGFAYVGGACVVNKRLEKVNSVAIIEDTGGFSGIIVAAHEVGHLLGAVHDGSPPPSYLGGPGAEKCRWEDGYIMSDLRHTERGFRWSPCSVQSFHHFLNGDTASCLHNPPHEDEALGRALPGTLLSLDAQCRRDRGTSACFKDERVCAQLFCFDSASGYCVAYRPAAEGSSCGDGQYGGDGGYDHGGHDAGPYHPTTTTTRKPKATYHPVFDVYFNRIAQTTTRNPYNFSYFAKRTTTNKSAPNYALNGNYLGANSQLSVASVAGSTGNASATRTGRYY